MNNKKLHKPFKKFINYKIITVCLLITALIMGVPYYIKHSIEQYSRLHEIEFDIDSMHFNWRIWKIPSFILNKIDIKNKGANPTFTHIKIENIVIEPDYGAFFKSYFKDYNFFLKVKSLKVIFINGSILEAGIIASNFNYKNNVYKIHNFSLYPFQVKLDKYHTSCVKKDDEKICEGRLIINVIKGEGQYSSVNKELEMYLITPQEFTQKVDGAPYSIQAKGKIKFLGLMPYQYGKNPDDPGVRGKITYTIENFSNLLHQLNQAKFISNIAENLGTIIGYPLPRIDPFTQQAEIFTNAISLDMTFKSDGTYLGSFKL